MADVELYYERRGDGPGLVVLPGLGGDTRLLAPLAEELAASHDVVAVDLRGAGRSPAPPGPYTVAMLAEDVAGLLARLGLERTAVLGYSLGGRVALQLAASRPERVHGLVLAATSPRSAPVRPLSRRWLATGVLGRVRLPRRLDPQTRQGHEAQRRASSAFDGRALLARVSTPTLAVRATRDAIVAPGAFALLRGIPGVEVVALPGGHLTLLRRHHAELAAATREFLSRRAGEAAVG